MRGELDQGLTHSEGSAHISHEEARDPHGVGEYLEIAYTRAMVRAASRNFSPLNRSAFQGS